MIDPKTAPDPQIGSNPELLALCQEHIGTIGELRVELADLKDIVIRRTCALQSLERQLNDLADIAASEWEFIEERQVRILAEEAKRAYTD